MLRRWIIRIIFMLPILLCVGGWGWSAKHDGRLEYHRHGHWFGGGTLWGFVCVNYGPPSLGEIASDGWICRIYPRTEVHFWPRLFTDHFSFLGFGYYSGFSITTIEVPYWFLILVFSALLFVVWRKTRPPVKGRAFPVELSNPKVEP